jgi:large subunit ribosomal protein L4e
VYGIDGKKTDKKLPLPDVFTAPIRVDIVNKIHALYMLNTRMPYAVSKRAGHQTSAESWGTGRAVARIPRVRGGGTHRSGQAAYGNMCRGGHMFNPTKVWRKWHHRINRKLRSFALASAIAATAIPALVEARGHVINKMPEFPMIIDNEVEGIKKTREAVAVLKKIQAYDDVEKSIATKRLRGTKGKMRNRRTLMKRGPLIVYKNDNGLVKAFRNVPGVSCMPTKQLHLLKLAPGGHVGRLVIWTQDAFESLESHFGSYSSGQTKLPLPIVKTSDLRAIIKNIASKNAVRPPKFDKIPRVKKVNPLKNRKVMAKLNPALALKRKAIATAAKSGTKSSGGGVVKKTEKVVKKKAAKAK